jgi:hypothetical protein
MAHRISFLFKVLCLHMHEASWVKYAYAAR